jgi:hypothetical protein
MKFGGVNYPFHLPSELRGENEKCNKLTLLSFEGKKRRRVKEWSMEEIHKQGQSKKAMTSLVMFISR